MYTAEYLGLKMHNNNIIVTVIFMSSRIYTFLKYPSLASKDVYELLTLPNNGTVDMLRFFVSVSLLLYIHMYTYTYQQ